MIHIGPNESSGSVREHQNDMKQPVQMIVNPLMIVNLLFLKKCDILNKIFNPRVPLPSLAPHVYHLILFLGLCCPPAAPVRQVSDPLRWIWFRVAPPSECVGHSHAKLKTAVETLINDSAHGNLWAQDEDLIFQNIKSLEYVTYCVSLNALWREGGAPFDVDLHDIVYDGLRWTCMLGLITSADLCSILGPPLCSAVSMAKLL